MKCVSRVTIAATLLALVLLTTSCGRNKEPKVTPEPPASAAADQQTAPDEAPEPADTAASDANTESNKDAENPPSESTPFLADGKDTINTSTGLQYTETETGTGKRPQPGDLVAVHYAGRLADGTEFDNSHKRGEPIRFPLGTGSVIAGWDEGIELMTEGGKATLVIPPELAYGAAGAGGGIIPPNATLTFDVELVEVSEGAPEAPAEVAEADYSSTDEGLKYYDFVVGDGASPQPGKRVAVHYSGWLQDGALFDSSLNRGEPIRFNIGMGQVIAGWDIGLRDMKVGGKRQLVIPPELAYGEEGAGGGAIPPDATLVFDVELVEAE